MSDRTLRLGASVGAPHPAFDAMARSGAKRILVVGGTGLLGFGLSTRAAAAGFEVTSVSRSRRFRSATGIHSVVADVARSGQAEELLASTRPDVVFNCAAITNVDACELGGDAARANAEWPGELALACVRSGARLVHVSTDSVFDVPPGDPPATETSKPAPVNAYARQKARAETLVLEATSGRAVVARTNFYGWSPTGAGLADWLVRTLRADGDVRGFADVRFQPLYVGELVEDLVRLASDRVEGVFHVLGDDCVSKFDFALALAEAGGLGVARITAGRLSDVDLSAPRPLNTCLATERMRSTYPERQRSLRAGLARLFAEEADVREAFRALEDIQNLATGESS